MVLVDTSVWINHLRRSHPNLSVLLEDGLVLMHPFVCGELACGNLQNRQIITDLRALPQAKMATCAEVHHLLNTQHLWGRGLGWIDVHLLASAMLSQSGFWTLDKTLRQAGMELGVRTY